MNILLLSYIMNVYYVSLRYYKMHIYICMYISINYQHIFKWKNLEFNN